MRSGESMLAWVALGVVVLGHAVGWGALLLGWNSLEGAAVGITLSFRLWLGAGVAAILEVAGSVCAIFALASGELRSGAKVAAILAIVLTILGIVGVILLVATGLLIAPLGASPH